MFCYFATLITDVDGAASCTQPQHVRTSALEWNPDTRAVEVVHNATPLPNVDINMSLQSSTYFKDLSAVVRRNSQCVKITASWDDLSQPPLAYHVWINPACFLSQITETGAIAKERYLRQALVDAVQSNCLVVRSTESAPQPDWEHTLHWMVTRDQAGATYISYPHHVGVTGTPYVFCLQELTFVPRLSAISKTIHLRGGLLLGSRNAGKTRMVKQLIQNGKLYSAGEQCPSFMVAVNATLLVLPPHLIDQWRAELEPDLDTLVVSDLTRWQAHCTFAALNHADVVITTPRFIRQHSLKRDPHILRKLKLCPSTSSKRTFISSVFWHRVVFDEVAAHTQDVVHVLTNKTIRCRMWWGLQGGVSVESLAMNALAHTLVGAGANASDFSDMVHHIPVLQKFALCDAPRLLHLTPVWLETTHMVTLHPQERAVYTVLHGAQASTLDLMYACAGSFKPVEVEYMRVVEDVLDAIPLGLEAIENTFITYDDEEEEEDEEAEEGEENQEEEAREASDEVEESGEEGDAHGAAEATMASESEHVEEDSGPEELESHSVSPSGSPPMPSPPVPSLLPLDPSQPTPAAERALELHGTTSQGLTFVVRTVGLAAFIESKTKMIEERKQFFRKTALALASGEQRVTSCPICLCDDAVCLLVCGHMVCQTCVFKLVNIARKNAEDDEDASDAEVLCPTCRCELDKDSIFWIMGARPRLYSKATKLYALLRQFSDAKQNAVVIAESQYLLQNTVMPQMQALGLSCMIVHSNARQNQRLPHKVNEWLATGKKGRCVFLELMTLRGMKLDHVDHVILFHPLSSPSKTVFENDILQSFLHNAEATVLAVHTLVADDTVEAACV